MYDGSAMDRNGHPLDINYMGMIISTSIIIVVMYKAMLEMYTVNIITILGCLVTLPIWFIFLFFWCGILKFSTENYWMVFDVARSPYFWLTVTITSVAAVLWDFCWKVLVRIIPRTRTLYHCVQEIPEELTVKQMRAVASQHFDLRHYALK
jgi:magnesium-transporting ATPase (P-type)